MIAVKIGGGPELLREVAQRNRLDPELLVEGGPLVVVAQVETGLVWLRVETRHRHLPQLLEVAWCPVGWDELGSIRSSAGVLPLD